MVRRYLRQHAASLHLLIWLSITSLVRVQSVAAFIGLLYATGYCATRAAVTGRVCAFDGDHSISSI